MELELMVDAGLTPEQALRSATGVAAECLMLDDVGTLEPGRWADFVVLGADPLQDIQATKTLERVFIGGNEVR
jgi:imidazolonepropionase-like amidohydrolase